MTKPYRIIRRFLSELVGISPDRNYCEVINLLFVLSALYLNILKTVKILQFWDKKKFSTCVARHSSASGFFSVFNKMYLNISKHVCSHFNKHLYIQTDSIVS